MSWYNSTIHCWKVRGDLSTRLKNYPASSKLSCNQRECNLDGELDIVSPSIRHYFPLSF
jgi:hypothetical protein